MAIIKRGRYQASIDTQNKILRLILENVEADQYWLFKQIGKEYSTTRRNLLILEHLGLVSYTRKKASKGWIDRKVYRLTKEGLIFVLMRFVGDIKSWDNLAKTYADSLPLIFGKWEKLKAFGIDQYVKECFRNLELYFKDRLILADLGILPGEDKDMLAEFADGVYQLIFGPFLTLNFKPPEPPFDRLKQLIQEDLDIKAFFVQTLEALERVHGKMGELLAWNREFFLSGGS